MRVRFFFVILTVLLVISFGSGSLYSYFLRQEKIAFIDRQVRQTAAALVDSELGDLRKINFEEADKIISEELGDSRVGKFFIIRNAAGHTIFESESAKFLPLKGVSLKDTWFQVSTKDKFIRGLNLKLPSFRDRSLQVGLVLDETFLSPSFLSSGFGAFVGVIFLLGLPLSLLLTTFLLNPVAKLGRFLSGLTEATRQQELLPRVPDSVARSPRADSRDEFKRVVAGLNGLIEKVNKNYQFSRLWAYQMAHEMKTPLSLANLEIEKLEKRHHLSTEATSELQTEMHKISETINSFLEWAELENSHQQKNLFLNRLATVVEEVRHRFRDEQSRIDLVETSSLVVIAKPLHLEQVILNLIQNALHHGGAECRVKVQITDRTIVIQDNGVGISDEVIKRFGEPFNRGRTSAAKTRGHGLGLARVVSVCRLYDWKIAVEEAGPGTRFTVTFPESPEQRSEPSTN